MQECLVVWLNGFERKGHAQMMIHLRARKSQRTDSPRGVVVILQPLTGFLLPACKVVEPLPLSSCWEDPKERVPVREVKPGRGLRSVDSVRVPSSAGSEGL